MQNINNDPEVVKARQDLNVSVNKCKDLEKQVAEQGEKLPELEKAALEAEVRADMGVADAKPEQAAAALELARRELKATERSLEKERIACNIHQQRVTGAEGAARAAIRAELDPLYADAIGEYLGAIRHAQAKGAAALEVVQTYKLNDIDEPAGAGFIGMHIDVGNRAKTMHRAENVLNQAEALGLKAATLEEVEL